MTIRAAAATRPIRVAVPQVLDLDLLEVEGGEDVRQEGEEDQDHQMMAEMDQEEAAAATDQEGAVATDQEGGVEEEVGVDLTVAGAALTSTSLTPTLLVEAAAVVQAQVQRTTLF